MRFYYADKQYGEIVNQLYNKSKTIEEIALELKIYEEVVVDLLMNYGNDVRSYYDKFLIDDDKFIVISDTQFGSPKQKDYFINYVYDYARKHGIHYIVHAGDFIEGKSNPTLITKDIDVQMEEAVKKYPYDENIKNYLLFGNHDFNVLKDDKFISLIESKLAERNDIIKIGTKKSYINWKNQTKISVNHWIRDYMVNVPDIVSDLNLYGHHHKYKLIDRDLFVPTLSVDMKCDSIPGFVVLTLNNDEIQINTIGFEPNLYYNPNYILYRIPEKVKLLKKS